MYGIVKLFLSFFRNTKKLSQLKNVALHHIVLYISGDYLFCTIPVLLFNSIALNACKGSSEA
ncbi:MAG: hypothetical protein LBU03_06290 [Tannerellaceae bacterium]|nr:hypothetical protein [Tannerellaceae bacterium]